MFGFKKKEFQYIYLIPNSESNADWSIIDQEELDHKVNNGELKEGCRLFRVDKEVLVSFETIVHLED